MLLRGAGDDALRGVVNPSEPLSYLCGFKSALLLEAHSAFGNRDDTCRPCGKAEEDDHVLPVLIVIVVDRGLYDVRGPAGGVDFFESRGDPRSELE